MALWLSNWTPFQNFQKWTGKLVISPLFFRIVLGLNAPYNYDCDHDYVTSVNQALMMVKISHWSHEKKNVEDCISFTRWTLCRYLVTKMSHESIPGFPFRFFFLMERHVFSSLLPLGSTPWSPPRSPPAPPPKMSHSVICTEGNENIFCFQTLQAL